MNILAITDHFITKNVINEELLPVLQHVTNLKISYISSEWPIEPVQNNDEVKEYLGSEEEITELARDADIIINHVGPITEKVLGSTKNLKLIAVMRGGPVNINIKEASRRGIPVVNAPGRNGPVVAEYTIGMILAAVHNIAQAHADMRNRIWRGDFYVFEKSGFELNGKIAGLIGFGAIGSLVAKILRSFGMKVLVSDPFVQREAVEVVEAELVTLEELLQKSDIVSLHARLSQETYHMMSKKEFSLMKKGAVLINTARGGLVNYKDLTESLSSGHLGAAALDVYYDEPLPNDSLLYDLPNVVLTPHIGGSSKETARRAVQIVSEDIINFLEGNPLKHCINREALENS